MKNIIHLLFISLSISLLSGCQNNKMLTLEERHSFFSTNLELPTNLEYGGFYSLHHPPCFAIQKKEHFIFFEYSDDGILVEMPLNELRTQRHIIVYLDVSSNWIILKNLFNELNGRTFNTIHIAYDNDDGYGTDGGATFPIKSTTEIKLGEYFNLVAKNDGSIIDLVSEQVYTSEDELRTSIGYDIDMILIRGSQDATAGQVIELFDALRSLDKKSEYLYIR